ncbi:MAG: glutamine amidotransferase [Croceicoccus sp.]|nr:glutamine amidotransferase [Croceicoccus sp.]MAL24542.1 glutamine amidotransferase [Croceicoccus sp.]|tara:strand:+ start:7130 stop:7828 length:699 start_codon:yes stop_codon:yes gene_type:complete
MKKQAVAIRHIEFEDLGYLATPLARSGFEVRYLDAGCDDFLSIDPVETPLVIVLGGPMGVYEQAENPFILQELEFLRARLAADRPTLGICLGAQMMASALGARVYHGKAKEIGFAPIRLTAAGETSPLAAIGQAQPVLHWHGDTFDLPAGSDLLASTDLYENQAFSRGPHILALQFHLEAGGDIGRWLTGHADELLLAGVDPEPIRADAARYSHQLETLTEQVLTSWLGLQR